MKYFAVYKSRVQQRTTKDGRVEFYTDVGIFYDKAAMGAAMEWSEHDSEKDAEEAWSAHCKKMRQEWPRRAGMDAAEADKYRQVSASDVTIDGAHTSASKQEPRTLFTP